MKVSRNMFIFTSVYECVHTHTHRFYLFDNLIHSAYSIPHPVLFPSYPSDPHLLPSGFFIMLLCWFGFLWAAAAWWAHCGRNWTEWLSLPQNISIPNNSSRRTGILRAPLPSILGRPHAGNYSTSETITVMSCDEHSISQCSVFRVVCSFHNVLWLSEREVYVSFLGLSTRLSFIQESWLSL